LRPVRLVLYWCLAALLLPVGYGARIAWTAVANASNHRGQRANAIAYVTRVQQRVGRQGQPLPDWVEEQLPDPLSFAYLRLIYRNGYAYWFKRHLEIALLYAAWPWLTMAALLIFRASMRRAKVRTVHVLRCSLYCCDAALWLGTATVLLVPVLMNRLDLGRYIGYRDLAIAALVFAPMTAWRLSAAYRHYLQFDHPVATAAAAQLVVLLGVLVVLYVHTPRFDF
jgi:hypothetical protein